MKGEICMIQGGNRLAKNIPDSQKMLYHAPMLRYWANEGSYNDGTLALLINSWRVNASIQP